MPSICVICVGVKRRTATRVNPRRLATEGQMYIQLKEKLRTRRRANISPSYPSFPFCAPTRSGRGGVRMACRSFNPPAVHGAYIVLGTAGCLAVYRYAAQPSAGQRLECPAKLWPHRSAQTVTRSKSDRLTHTSFFNILYLFGDFVRICVQILCICIRIQFIHTWYTFKYKFLHVLDLAVYRNQHQPNPYVSPQHTIRWIIFFVQFHVLFLVFSMCLCLWSIIVWGRAIFLKSVPIS